MTDEPTDEARAWAINTLGKQNSRFLLYREQDPTFRQADVDFLASEVAPILRERDAWAERCKVAEQDLAIAGVRGSPPPFEATIPRLKRELRAAEERARRTEELLVKAHDLVGRPQGNDVAHAMACLIDGILNLKEGVSEGDAGERRWREIADELAKAMRMSVEEGCTDHLDAADDYGAFWYDPLARYEAAKADRG